MGTTMSAGEVVERFMTCTAKAPTRFDTESWATLYPDHADAIRACGQGLARPCQARRTIDDEMEDMVAAIAARRIHGWVRVHRRH